MGRVRWGRVLAVLLAVVAAARWQDARELLAQIGAFLADTLSCVWETPPAGRAMIVLMLIALVYVTAVILAKEWIWSRGRPGKEEADTKPSAHEPGKEP
ncbi:MAG TPA: hypothetical protein VM238_10815 [Phycisphaerae bacterium]|nr:hypothetical protein [Phycisphaerae bacterium]